MVRGEPVNPRKAEEQLSRALALIAMVDPSREGSDKTLHDYDIRNHAVVESVWLALRAGYPAGFTVDRKDGDWVIAYISLPEVGQVSWHVPRWAAPWDGHTTEEKYDRVKRYLIRNEDKPAWYGGPIREHR